MICFKKLFLIFFFIFSIFFVGDIFAGESSHQAPGYEPLPTKELRALAELKDRFLFKRNFSCPDEPISIVYVYNNSNQALKLTLSGTIFYEINIPPKNLKKVAIMPGTYTYHAVIPGYPPLNGSQKFNSCDAYDWEFSYKSQ